MTAFCSLLCELASGIGGAGVPGLFRTVKSVQIHGRGCLIGVGDSNREFDGRDSVKTHFLLFLHDPVLRLQKVISDCCNDNT